MNQREATKQAKNNTLTWQQLKDMVDNQSGEGMSKVNPALTKQQALDIFSNYFDTIENMNAVPKGSHISIFNDKVRLTSNGCAIRNILIECS